MEKIKIKFNSFDEYVDWALKKLRTEIPGLSEGALVKDYGVGAYRCLTYEFTYHSTKLEFDFEMESNYEWYAGNKQEDPDWVYSPARQEYQIWGGVQRLADRLKTLE